MRNKVLAVMLVVAVAFTLSVYLSAHSKSDFYVEICEEHLHLYAENTSGEEVDSYTIRAKIYDINWNLLETETYSGDHFTTLWIQLEHPEGWCFAKAVLTVRMMDGTVYKIDSYFD